MSSGHQYFQLIDDLSFDGRWFLNSVQDALGRPVNPELFTVCRRLDGIDTPLRIFPRRTGRPLDWTYADFDMPVASGPIIEILNDLSSQVQIIPAVVDSHKGVFGIVNILDLRDCLDESRSEFIRWRPEDGRPDRLGQYRQVSTLRVLHERVGHSEIFRIKGWDVAIVVSSNLREQFDHRGITGVTFLPVS